MEFWLSSQAVIFLILTVAGFLLGFLYDVLRIARNVLRFGAVWVALQDVLFWLKAVALLFVVLMYTNYGQIRGFVFLAAGLGVLLYFLSISRKIFKFGTKTAVFAIGVLRKGKNYGKIKVVSLQKMIRRGGDENGETAG
ncbi:MAG: spore cortex biosynthesis protein YabQ [Defluviitaleaceae bacterium]|nr:spore cortex biosynthesis protein YabQ [Defluviitaleaceae bacterium]